MALGVSKVCLLYAPFDLLPLWPWSDTHGGGISISLGTVCAQPCPHRRSGFEGGNEQGLLWPPAQRAAGLDLPTFDKSTIQIWSSNLRREIRPADVTLLPIEVMLCNHHFFPCYLYSAQARRIHFADKAGVFRNSMNFPSTNICIWIMQPKRSV